MGLCFGRCFSKENLNFTYISDGQDCSFMDCDTTDENRSSQPPATLAGILKFKTKYHSKFLNRFWARHRHQQSATQCTSYARLNASRRNSVTENENQNYDKAILPKDAIQLQCLDVGSLLKMNERRDYKRLQCDSLTEGTLSFAGSSLDLEWEHEYDAAERDENQDDPRNAWFQSEEDSSSSSSEENGHSIELSQFSSPTHKLNRQNNNCPPLTNTQWHSRHRRQGKARSRNETNRSTSAMNENSENKIKKHLLKLEILSGPQIVAIVDFKFPFDSTIVRLISTTTNFNGTKF